MNTAGRILSIYVRLARNSHNQDDQMLKVWAEVFDLSLDSPHLEDDVVMCLQALRQELKLLSVKLKAIGVDDSLMHPGLTRLRNISTTTILHNHWKNVRDEQAQPENHLAFQWANWALREDEEDSIPDDDLNTLRDEIASLERALNETEMSPPLRSFVMRQVEAIRTALRVYKVQGIEPIETALHQVAGAFTIGGSFVEKEYGEAPPAAKSLLSRFNTFVEKTAKVADNATKIHKGYELAAKVAPALIGLGRSLI